MTKANEPAFPVIHDYETCQKTADGNEYGLTKREYVAIHLGVPDSGNEQLDAMIRKANRRDQAAMAMQGIRANDHDELDSDCAAIQALSDADALLKRLEADDGNP